MVVTVRDLVHAALWLVATLFGVAIIYTLLNAGFLAVVQVVVYIGAIAILFIFAVMLTRRQAADTGASVNKNWWAGRTDGCVDLRRAGLSASELERLLEDRHQPSRRGLMRSISWATALTSPAGYVLPFEVASVLLLAALVGAVYLAFNKK